MTEDAGRQLDERSLVPSPYVGGRGKFLPSAWGRTGGGVDD